MGRKAGLVLVVVDGLMALAAVGGGLAMLTGLDKFPAEWLEGTPFSSYALPGLLLALVVGGSATVATVGLLRRRWGGEASAIAGALLMGWLVGEVIMLNQPSAPTPTEIVFFVMGLVMLVLGLYVARNRRRLKV